jgi:ribonuclease III
LSRPAALEQRLGHRFTRLDLLEQALTHASFGPDNNERLEFLGDGVLGCAIAEELCARFPALPEGKLTQLRAALVREESLAEVAGEIGLAGFLRVGAAGPRPSILADALEAVFGAVLLDAGYEAARGSIVRAFGAVLDRLDPQSVDKDAKTRLQEVLHARRQQLPEYRVIGTSGAPHERAFEVECVLAELGLKATGSGSSRQRAEQEAARAVLAQMAKA